LFWRIKLKTIKTCHLPRKQMKQIRNQKKDQTEISITIAIEKKIINLTWRIKLKTNFDKKYQRKKIRNQKQKDKIKITIYINYNWKIKLNTKKTSTKKKD
jgi:hypothetical protein